MPWLSSNRSCVISDFVSRDKYFIFLHFVTLFYPLYFFFPCISFIFASLSIFPFLVVFSWSLLLIMILSFLASYR